MTHPTEDGRAGADPAASTAPKMRGATTLLADILEDLRADADTRPGTDNGSDTARLGDVLDRMDGRAFGLLLLLLALPCCLPFVYLLPQVVSLPILALAAQLAAGKTHPWMPEKMRARSFAIDDFSAVLTRSKPYVGWIEMIARPRFSAVTGRFGARIVGALLLIPAASILVPLPSTNTVPGIGVAIVALGLVERDGALIIGGLLIGFLWVGLLLFFGAEAASLIKDFVLSRF
ncbi:MAG: exopolysaccharide biosynthesis protein [Pseudomonadota bacterium]